MRTLLEMAWSNALLATVLALVAAAVSQVCRRPAIVHSLWLLVLLKLVTPPLIPVSLPWLTPVANEQPEAVEPTETSLTVSEVRDGSRDSLSPTGPTASDPTSTALAPRPLMQKRTVQPNRSFALAKLLRGKIQLFWRETLAFLWLGGALFWFARTGLQVHRFQRLLGHAQPAPAELQDQVQALAQRLGLSPGPGVWLIPGVVSPMLWAIGRRPRLLFPAKLLDRIDWEQQATLFTHELAHLRRRDHWIRIVEMLVSGLYWWHPVVWWARRQLRQAEEQCCDAWVVWALASAERTYATALVQTVAFLSHAPCPVPMAASGIGQVRQLRRRLTMIMQARTPRSMSWAGLCAVLGLGLLLLPLQAQQPTDKGKTQPAGKPGKPDAGKTQQTGKPEKPGPEKGWVIELQGYTYDRAQPVDLQVLVRQEKRFTYIDLQPYANQKLTDNFHSRAEGNNLAALPKDEQTFAGVKFHIGEGVIQLGSTVLTDMAQKVEGIEVNKAFDTLHMLHATAYGRGNINTDGTKLEGGSLLVADGVLVGRIRVHYDDTSVEVIPIVYGKDVRDWWFNEEDEKLTRGDIAWQGENERTKKFNTKIRLYKTTWKNPKPNKKVASLEYISMNNTAAAPFCVAMTVEGK
jgi:beta-lactamase regulating signal transducer with metallopeptidase domain